MNLEGIPLDLLLLQFHDIDTPPAVKIELGQELRRRGKYPKVDPFEVPKFTPRYGSG